MMRTDILEGAILVRRAEDGRCVVEEAPKRSYMSLELLGGCDPKLVKIRGRDIRFAGQVTYEVVGWDAVQSALILDRRD